MGLDFYHVFIPHLTRLQQRLPKKSNLENFKSSADKLYHLKCLDLETSKVEYQGLASHYFQEKNERNKIDQNYNCHLIVVQVWKHRRTKAEV